MTGSSKWFDLGFIVARSDQSQMTLHYGDAQIPYIVRVNSNRKAKVEINVLPDGAVEVEAPEEATQADIAKAVHKRARWIVNHVTDARRRFEHVLPRQYVSGEQILYLGRRYSLKVQQVARVDRSVKLKGSLLMVLTPATDPEAVRAKVRAWMRMRAREYIAQRLSVVCKSLPWPQSVPGFRLQEMKTQWGNCAVKGAIVLNPSLVKAPRACIDYVITHELCHLREHNHSPEFFRLLSKASPGWEGVKATLDEMAETLLNE